jgi:hypothetical protein
MKRWWPIIVNVIAFDATWTIALMAAARGYAWAGAAVMLANVAGHLAMTPRTLRGREAGLIAAGAAVGAGVDSVWLALGVIGFAGTDGVTARFLVFFFALWANFGTTLRVGFSWAWDRAWVGVIIGVAGGPLSYLIGERIGAVSFPGERTRSLGILAAEFAVMTSAWIWAAGRVLRRGVA